MRIVKLWENIRLATDFLTANKLRSGLTMLGMIIGVGAVITLVSIGEGARSQVTQQIEGLGTNLISVMPGSAQRGRMFVGMGTVTSLTYEDAEAIAAHCPAVKAVAPEITRPVTTRYSGNNWSTNMTATTTEFQEIRRWPVSEGRFFDHYENQGQRLVCVLGDTVIKNLFGNEEYLGKVIKIESLNFRVIGRMSPKGSQGFFDFDDLIFIPLLTAQRKVFNIKNVRNISVEVKERQLMEEAKSQIRNVLRQRHRLGPGEDDDFMLFSQTDILQTAQGVTTTLTLLLASIAGVSLIVGGIGIMNIMLVSVTERTREIGLRKAVGARQKDILLQFVTEATMLSVVGGVMGIVLGAGGAKLFTYLLRWPMGNSWFWYLVAVGFSGAIGMFFGIYPAWRAARLDPIVALRYE